MRQKALGGQTLQEGQSEGAVTLVYVDAVEGAGWQDDSQLQRDPYYSQMC